MKGTGAGTASLKMHGVWRVWGAHFGRINPAMHAAEVCPPQRRQSHARSADDTVHWRITVYLQWYITQGSDAMYG